MSATVYAVSISTFRRDRNGNLNISDESTLANVYITKEAAEKYGNEVFEQRIKDLPGNKRTSTHGCKYIDPENGDQWLIHYEVFELNLINE